MSRVVRGIAGSSPSTGFGGEGGGWAATLWPKRARMIGAAALALLAAACNSAGTPKTATPAATGAAVAPQGDVFGTGTVTVALLLPLQSPLGQSFRNAAALAVGDFPQGNIRVIVKDDSGSQDGGRSAAQAAIGEGAQIILGPIFAPAVAGAASVAKPAAVPIVGFSTDTTVASRGVYLLSFLPQQDVARVVGYAASVGKRSVAALLPDNAYGTVAEAALRESAGRLGVRVATIARYAPSRADFLTKAQQIASLGGQIDAVFVPEGGDGAAQISDGLQKSGLSGRVQLLGSGQWDDPRVAALPGFSGGWYPSADKAGFATFSTHYAQKYGQPPPRTASLAYDATTLAAGLVRSAGAPPFTDTMMTNPNGFIGVDGLFRFQANGTNERGLAVYQISGGNVTVLSPAPRSFNQAS